MLRGFTRFYHSFFMSVRQLSFFCFNIRERLLDKLAACKFLSITEFWSNKQELHKWWLIPEIRSHIPLRISRLHERVTTKTHSDWLALLSAPVVVTVAKYCFLASKKNSRKSLGGVWWPFWVLLGICEGIKWSSCSILSFWCFFLPQSGIL